MSFENILDSEELGKEDEIILATLMDRLRHFSIDGTLVVIISLVINLNFSVKYFSQANGKTGNIFLSTLIIIYFLYYITSEWLTGRTLGKVLNKTRVVSIRKGKPNFIEVLIRAILRIIPGQTLAYRSAFGQPLHDIASKTYVFRD